MELRGLGLDVGGANLKACLIELGRDGMVAEPRSKYLPIWKVGRRGLEEELEGIARSCEGVEVVGLTMTAELSDLYYCKREGVEHVVSSVVRAFQGVEVWVLTVRGSMVTPEEAMASHLDVAAANWAATGWLASRIMGTCVVVDVGSTTTSIVPVVDGRTVARGLNDLEKLACGELVYTGALRTNVAAVVDRVPLRGAMVRTSSELFATTADVHLLLGHIGEEDYTVDTADGRGRSREEAMARLARVVCADHEMLSAEEILGIARYVYERQVEAIAEALVQVYTRLWSEFRVKPPGLIAGIGAEFLAKPALMRAGVEEVVRLSDVVGRASSMAPALGVGLMAMELKRPGEVARALEALRRG